MKKRSGRFLEELHERALVCDGAMGTQLYSKGIPINRCFEELNLVMPSLVKEVHEDYQKAGAEILETNTFGANPLRLAAYGLREKLREINEAGVRLARECAGPGTFVAGAVGPLGVRLQPLGLCTREQAHEAFREQILVLADAGVDVILLETFYDLEEIQEALAAARAACDLPVVAQVTIDDDGNLLSGTSPEDFTRILLAAGADAVGCNCSVGPKVMLDTIQRMASLSNRPLTAQPNAGLPMNVGGRNIYLCSPEYMAGYAGRFLQNGVKLLGGCCGTTPEHIRAIQEAVRASQPSRPKVAVSAMPPAVVASKTLEPIPLAARSQLARKMAQKEFLVLADILPPQGCDPTKELEGAQYLAQSGVDGIYVPDGPRAGARMSAQVLAHLIQKEAGIETMAQYSCRDRNIVGIQSDLLGAHVLGLRNLVLITGEPPRKGNYPDATAVFDVDSIGLTKIVANLNQGLDIGGNFLGNQTGFWVAVLANPSAMDFEQEVDRLEAKVRVGAECMLTFPVFDLEQLDRFLERTRTLRLPLIAGLYPLTSYRNAEFLSNELQISIAEPILERMRAVESGEAARAAGIRIAQELALELRNRVQGIHVTAPLGRYSSVIEVIGALGQRVGETAPAHGAVPFNG